MNQDILDIKNQFDKVVKHSQGILEVNSQPLFEKWYEAKKSFIEKWGGYIYNTGEVFKIPLSEEEKYKKLEEFIYKLRYEHGLYELSNFVEENKSTFFENTVNSNLQEREKIKKGMRLIKSFKYFIDNETHLSKIQDAASMIIQEEKIVGELCLSVHPLDFLSLSENSYNWRSCHALDGEFRAGNLSYMVDNSTIIAYIKSEKGDIYNLPHFPQDVKWNSKKWRMLLYVSPDFKFVAAGKQYPFHSDNILTIVRRYLLSSFHYFRSFTYFSNDYITDFKREDENVPLRKKYLEINGYLYSLGSLIKDHKDNMAFNDVLSSSTYTKPYYMYQLYSSGKPEVITVGGTVPCLYCGKDELIVSDSFLCQEHELEFGSSEDDSIGVCQACGRRFLREDEEYNYVEGYGIVCEDCIDSLDVVECSCCGTYILIEDAKVDSKENYYCDYCYRWEVDE